MAVSILIFWLLYPNSLQKKTKCPQLFLILPHQLLSIIIKNFRISWKKFGMWNFEAKTASIKCTSFEQKKSGLEGFQKSDLAYIIGECIKFDFAKFLLQPRGCISYLKIRGHSRPPEANQWWGHFDPHIWYLNDFPWSQDVKNDLGLERPQWPRIFKQPLQPQKLAHENRGAKRFIHVKYEHNRPSEAPSNNTFLFKICNLCRGCFGLKISHSKLFSTDTEILYTNWFADH